MGKTLHLFILLAILFIGVIKANGAEENLTAIWSGFTSKVCNIEFAINSGKTKPAWNDNSKEYRLYAKGTLTITPNEGIIITQIDYTFIRNKNSEKLVPKAKLSSTEGTFSVTDVSATWKGSTTKAIVLLADGSGGNLGFTNLKITYHNTSTGKTKTAIVFANPENKTFALNAVEGITFVNAATLSPNIENAIIAYSSDNESIATVDGNGTVSVVTNKEGTATITATYAGNDKYDGATTSYKITVVDNNKTTWSYAFQDKDLNRYSTYYTFNNATWTFIPRWKDGPFFSMSNDKGIQIGSGGNPATSLVFSSNYFPGVINEVKVNAAAKDAADVTISVTVGGVSYGEAKNLTDNSADYVFTGSSTGEIVITFLQPETSKAIYIKKFEIEYNPNGELKTIILDENETTKNFEAGIYSTAIVKRTFNDNAWNTLVLPFDLTSEQIAAEFGSDAKVASYTGATENADGSFSLNFKETTSITANVPVFIYGVEEKSDGYNFVGVEVKDKTPTQSAEGFNFVGTYAKTTVPVGNFFINSKNIFYKAGDNQTNIKGTRATFEPESSASSAKRLGFNVSQGNNTTAINAITMQEEANPNEPMYNLAGQCVNKVYKGVVLQNGRKFIQK